MSRPGAWRSGQREGRGALSWGEGQQAGTEEPEEHERLRTPPREGQGCCWAFSTCTGWAASPVTPPCCACRARSGGGSQPGLLHAGAGCPPGWDVECPCLHSLTRGSDRVRTLSQGGLGVPVGWRGGLCVSEGMEARSAPRVQLRPLAPLQPGAGDGGLLALNVSLCMCHQVSWGWQVPVPLPTLLLGSQHCLGQWGHPVCDRALIHLQGAPRWSLPAHP